MCIRDSKRVVQVYDYVDFQIPMLARMFERRLKGYSAIGYTVEGGEENTKEPSAHNPQTATATVVPSRGGKENSPSSNDIRGVDPGRL